MFWNRLASFMLGGGMLVARPFATSDLAPVRLGELLSYDCARAVAGMVATPHSPGPVFRERDLVFVSVETEDHRPELMISAGAGIFTVELAHSGVNRLRFELPDATGHAAVTYYLTYLHDDHLGSRYLDFGQTQPPVGHFDIDYLAVVPRRADNLVAHLDYATFLTSDKLRVTKARVGPKLTGACDHLRRENPALARALFINLDQIDLASRQTARMPASLR